MTGEFAMVTLTTDLASFPGAGYGTVRVPAGTHLRAGDLVAVTDDDADTLQAEVLSVAGDRAEIRVHWDRVLHRA